MLTTVQKTSRKPVGGSVARPQQPVPTPFSAPPGPPLVPSTSRAMGFKKNKKVKVYNRQSCH